MIQADRNVRVAKIVEAEIKSPKLCLGFYTVSLSQTQRPVVSSALPAPSEELLNIKRIDFPDIHVAKISRKPFFKYSYFAY